MFFSLSIISPNEWKIIQFALLLRHIFISSISVYVQIDWEKWYMCFYSQKCYVSILAMVWMYVNTLSFSLQSITGRFLHYESKTAQFRWNYLISFSIKIFLHTYATHTSHFTLHRCYGIYKREKLNKSINKLRNYSENEIVVLL